MNTFHFEVKSKTILGDLITPIQYYLKIRDIYPHSILLESSDYHDINNSFSFICINPISFYKIDSGQLSIKYPDENETKSKVSKSDFLISFEDYKNSFKIEGDVNSKINGLFGYCSYDAVPYFETLTFKNKNNKADIPEFFYSFYQNIIIFNHFNNQIEFIEFENHYHASQFQRIIELMSSKEENSYPFKKIGETTSNVTDIEFMEIVEKGKKSCFRGDVFQIVLSRQFQQEYSGDEFTLYRALRSINPSPYLFYFDYGGFKIMGSSPEAQLIIINDVAEIHPIAGTYKRTGDDEKDELLAIDLSNDDKENAEHVMLVDLARNDLSRNSEDVFVEKYKEIQYFSHVIHMVSKVKAKMQGYKSIKTFMDTFPAGTLSGAPKYKAMSLIDEYENQNRGIYGGAIGFIGFNNNINTAIVIRTFVAKDNYLYFQAGAGVVSKSVKENELQEVNNKLGALQKAIEMADGL